MSYMIRKGMESFSLSSKLTKQEKRKLIKLMARIQEDAYRRGAQQAATLQKYGEIVSDLAMYRFEKSLDKSPMLGNGKINPCFPSSIDRLEIEYGPQLYDFGLEVGV